MVSVRHPTAGGPAPGQFNSGSKARSIRIFTRSEVTSLAARLSRRASHFGHGRFSDSKTRHEHRSTDRAKQYRDTHRFSHGNSPRLEETRIWRQKYHLPERQFEGSRRCYAWRTEAPVQSVESVRLGGQPRTRKPAVFTTTGSAAVSQVTSVRPEALGGEHSCTARLFSQSEVVNGFAACREGIWGQPVRGKFPAAIPGKHASIKRHPVSTRAAPTTASPTTKLSKLRNRPASLRWISGIRSSVAM